MFEPKSQLHATDFVSFEKDIFETYIRKSPICETKSLTIANDFISFKTLILVEMTVWCLENLEIFFLAKQYRIPVGVLLTVNLCTAVFDKGKL